jgi:hypothetical protein
MDPDVVIDAEIGFCVDPPVPGEGLVHPMKE